LFEAAICGLKHFFNVQRYKYSPNHKAFVDNFSPIFFSTARLSDRPRVDPDGAKAISWIPIEALFAEKELRLSYNDIKQCKTALVGECRIDKFFA